MRSVACAAAISAVLLASDVARAEGPVVPAAPADAGRALVGPNVNVSNLPGWQGGSSITLDTAAPNFVLAGSSHGALYASSDSGATWAYRAFPTPYQSRGQLSVAVDATGRSYAAEVALGSLKTGGGAHIVLATSVDHGFSWTGGSWSVNWPAWVRLAADSVATSPCANNLYLAWTEGPNLYLERWTSGSGWGPVILLSSGNVATPIHATGANGEVYVAFAEYGQGRLLLSRSTDCGATFGSPAQIADTGASLLPIPAACTSAPAGYPSLDVDRSNGPRRGWLYVAFTDGVVIGGCAANSADVKFIRSTDGGATWTTPKLVHENLPGTDQFHPWLAVDSFNGDIHVMYDDTRDDPARLLTNVYINSSTDGGSTWSLSLKVSTAQTNETCCGAANEQYGPTNGLVAYRGISHASWTDRRSGGDEEIYTARIDHMSGPVADFSGSPRTGDPPLTVAFADLSTGAPTSWSWAFGDGGTSTARNPGHVYNVPGSYDVGLMACSASGCNGASKLGYITVTVPNRGDLVTGAGPGAGNPATIAIWNHTDPPVATASWLGFAAGWGVNVDAADISGAQTVRVLAGPGPGGSYGPQVRAFDATGTPLGKVNFYAYGTLRFGVNVANADVDADGYAEIVTGPGPGSVFGPHVRGWNFDNASISAIPGLSFFAYGTLAYGVNPTGGSVNPDPFEEIVTGPGPGLSFAPTVRGFDWDGGPVKAIAKINFNAFPTVSYGARVAAGDIDGDGFAEIAAAQGPGPSLDDSVNSYDYDGAAIVFLSLVHPYTALTFGARIGAGDVNGGASEELLACPGPGPANPARLTGFAWNGSAMSIVVPDFPAGNLFYGANPASGELGAI